MCDVSGMSFGLVRGEIKVEGENAITRPKKLAGKWQRTDKK